MYGEIYLVDVNNRNKQANEDGNLKAPDRRAVVGVLEVLSSIKPERINSYGIVCFKSCSRWNRRWFDNMLQGRKKLRWGAEPLKCQMEIKEPDNDAFARITESIVEDAAQDILCFVNKTTDDI